MDIDESPPSGEYASQVCAACRQKKRKCDKVLPICSLCQRIGRDCDYSDETRPQHFNNEDIVSLRSEVAELKQLLLSQAQIGISNRRPEHSRHMDHRPGKLPTPPTEASPRNLGPGVSLTSMFFLDSLMFHYQGIQIPVPHVRIPPGTLSCLGNSFELREMIEVYFKTVHSYFPVISKVRLFQNLATLSDEPGADLALLFLAIKLVMSTIPTGSTPQTQLYQDVKAFLHYVEAQNGLSVQFIQSLLLISLYEIGHSIYPAAYLSTGHALGLHTPHAPQMIPKPTTWTEQEERRRIQWAIYLLDRTVSTAARSKPLATPEPDLSTHLPADDTAWDRGAMLPATPLALSASPTVLASPFARTCQAAHLFSKVIQHGNDRTLPPEYRFEEAIRLDRTIRTFGNLLLAEAAGQEEKWERNLDSAMGLCLTARSTLYDLYSCTETARQNGAETGTDGELVVQKMCIEGIYEVAEEARELGIRVKRHLEGSGVVSPFVIESVYSGAANFAWVAKESADQEYVSKTREMKGLLSVIDGKWKVAGEYRRLVEAGEFHYANTT